MEEQKPNDISDYGFPDDGYDYSQHLGTIGGGNFFARPTPVPPEPEVAQVFVYSVPKIDRPLDREVLQKLEDDDLSAEEDIPDDFISQARAYTEKAPQKPAGAKWTLGDYQRLREETRHLSVEDIMRRMGLDPEDAERMEDVEDLPEGPQRDDIPDDALVVRALGLTRGEKEEKEEQGEEEEDEEDEEDEEGDGEGAVEDHEGQTMTKREAARQTESLIPFLIDQRLSTPSAPTSTKLSSTLAPRKPTIEELIGLPPQHKKEKRRPVRHEDEELEEEEEDAEEEVDERDGGEGQMLPPLPRRRDASSEADGASSQRFKEVLRDFDDSQIGALDECQEETLGKEDVDQFGAVLDEFLVGKERHKTEYIPKKDKVAAFIAAHETEFSSRGTDVVDIEVRKPRTRSDLDCESIISSYSNLDNHPAVIQDKPPKKKHQRAPALPPEIITLSSKTGLPIGVQIGQTTKPEQEEEEELPRPGALPPQVRSKDETKEEKKARKQLVKQARKQSREQKTTMRALFASETERQKTLLSSKTVPV